MKKHVLFAEDDASLREVFEIEFSEIFRISLAATVDSALQIISGSAQIDYLVTDLDMSDEAGRSGLEIAKNLRLRFSTTPVVLATGSSLSNIEFNILRDELNGVLLAKPYQSSELIEALSDARLAMQSFEDRL